ncbi:hypothetical protein HC031_14475 [Planosporangium thailandense]|uniref:Uncharacterized protein n=1 Tax=Planosporangium thailandense TaxID=765197 RepID=A0ABX0XYE2_9ACTN|nr:hypothetical protein [Planosporangium thailandense]NJC70912.1 hypothetical protein [Planosporangium thailandense]
MPSDRVDPSGNTEQFKAFAQAPPEGGRSSRRLLVTGVAVVVALVVLTAYLALS